MENNNIVKKKKSLTKQKIENLEKQVQELTKSLKNEENAKLLALADLDNMRKRFVKEKDLIEFKTTEKVIDPFLKVFEHFQMALASLNKCQNIQLMKNGLNIILDEFNNIFLNLGITKIKTVGQKFNPLFHDAVNQQSSQTIPEGIIIQEWAPGFIQNNKVLKAAAVVVSTGK